jgi:hypothetical protein
MKYISPGHPVYKVIFEHDRHRYKISKMFIVYLLPKKEKDFRTKWCGNEMFDTKKNLLSPPYQTITEIQKPIMYIYRIFRFRSMGP